MIGAIVPASGLSSRMGFPKLLLPIGGVPLIARVVLTLIDGGASEVVVVALSPTQPGGRQIASIAGKCGATVAIPPQPPPDMRSSFEFGLQNLEFKSEQPIDGVLLAPGDSPGIDSGLVRAMISEFDTDACDCVVPTVNGRRAHPLLLSWKLALSVRRLPQDSGINSLLKQPATRVRELPWHDPTIALDLDTPDDYRRWADVPSE